MRAAVIIAVTVGYYTWLSQKTAPFFARAVLRLMTSDRHSVHARLQVARLLVATVQQMLFLFSLLMLTQVDPFHVMSLNARDLFLGALLGLGLMGTASLLCQVAVGVADVVAPSPDLRAMADWQVLISGGWMGQFYHALRVIPYWLVVLFTAGYVSVEEFLFRSVLITPFLPYGHFIAWTLSLGLFMLAQLSSMPSWRTALFPLVGAGTLGAVHGFLYIRGTNIVVLIISHIAFFLLAVRPRD